MNAKRKRGTQPEWAAGSSDAAAHVVIGLGINSGDRLAILRSAVAELASGTVAGSELVATSAIYETRPVGDFAGTFFNAAIMVRTSASADALLHACMQLEAAHGRRRCADEALRGLDLDLLLWLDRAHGKWISRPSSTSQLVLPHPRMADRDFVLAPLCDLLPDAAVIDGMSARQRLASLPSAHRTIVRRLPDPLAPRPGSSGRLSPPTGG